MQDRKVMQDSYNCPKKNPKLNKLNTQCVGIKYTKINYTLKTMKNLHSQLFCEKT